MDTSTVTRPSTDTGHRTPLRVAVIIASVREGRLGPLVADWFVHRATGPGFEVDLVDLADPGADVAAHLDHAEAFVVVTPEYNHSYPAPLKEVVDRHRTEWFAKPVAFVSYGGVSGGLRAVEHLRLVFAELHATTVRDTVSFAFAWESFDDAGHAEDEGADGAADVLLDRLAWWGHALRTARRDHPFAA